jgi:hypothetical protein
VEAYIGDLRREPRLLDRSIDRYRPDPNDKEWRNGLKCLILAAPGIRCGFLTSGNLSVSASVQPDELMYRGAAALALADILTSRGVNVGIVLFYSIRRVTSTIKAAVVKYIIKDPLMPMDVSAVAFAMCEIAFFRVVGALGAPRHFPGKLREDLGLPANIPAADRQSIDFLIEADVLGEQAATSWLRGCLAGSESEVHRA